MKRFLLIPSCALLAFGMLTSCQKEDKTAQQLAEELTAELQKVTDYKTAEAVAPRVEALNKRFQNASVRVFSADANALAASNAGAYTDAVSRLLREMGRVQASKPVTAADGEVDDASLVAAVGVGAGVPVTSTPKEQFAKGQMYIYNSSSETNNNPPAFAEYYGSEKLASALAYVASTSDNGAFKCASEEDVPAIPAAVEVEAEAMPSMEEAAAAEEDAEPAAAEDEPAVEDEPVADEEVAAEEEPAADEDVVADEEPTADEPAAEEAAEEEPAPADDTEETDDATGDVDLGEEEDLGGEEEIELEL